MENDLESSTDDDFEEEEELRVICNEFQLFYINIKFSNLPFMK